MKKNKFLFLGMFALALALALTFTLVLAGCPDPTPTPPDPTPAELAAKLAADLGGSGKATAVDAAVTLDADVSLTAALTVPASVTLTVPQDTTLATGNFTLTVNGTLKLTGTGAITGSGTISYGAGGKAIGTYGPSAVANTNPAQLTVSVTGFGTATVAITLGGAVASGFPSTDLRDDFVGFPDTTEGSGGSDYPNLNFDATKAAQGYTVVTLAGVTSGWVTGTNTYIKQTNRSFNLYERNFFAITGFGTDTVYKEKPYGSNPQEDATFGGFDFLLWQGASSKVITIQSGGTAAATGYTNTVTVDYSGLTITP
jgi:hypothetical protein